MILRAAPLLFALASTSAFAADSVSEPPTRYTADEANPNAETARAAIEHMTLKRQLEKLEYHTFCTRFGVSLRAKKTDEKKQAALQDVASETYSVTGEWYPNIRDRRLQVGMPLCAVLAALGLPSELREIGTGAGVGYSLWYRERKALIYIDRNQRVISYNW